MRRWVALFVLVVVAACGSGGRDGAAPIDRATTTAAVTTTSEPRPQVPPATEPPAAVQIDPVPAREPRALTTPTGVVAPIIGTDPAGYVVRTPCGRQATIASGTPHPGAHAVLDAGHGGGETGAVGPAGLTEKALNLAVSLHAEEALEAAGLEVLQTRTQDYRITLATRAEIATLLEPRVFVSIHHNAAPDGEWPRPGTETFYQIRSADSKRLAGLIWEEVVAALSRFEAHWVADTDAGAKYRPNSQGGDYYGILRRSERVTAVLAELAFVSNPSEEALLARPDVQKAEGVAVARGILRYLKGDEPRPDAFTEPYPRETPAGPGGGAEGCEDPPLS
jgi:N-acetylmuramoyl-L-alanine amidase